MKTIITITLLLLLVTGGMAADKPAQQVPGKSPETAGEQKETSGQKAAEKKTTVQWPRPYQPSEEVSADSMVPFPTDI